MTEQIELETLTYFIGCYVHQDFDDIDRTVEEFCEEIEVTRAALIADIEALLATAAEAETEAVLHEMGSAYLPLPGPEPYRAWLREVAAVVRASLE